MPRRKRPVAGVETPRDDDIITPCAGGCGRFMVQEHPRHTTCGSDVFGGDWKPTPAWVEAEAERRERGDACCAACHQEGRAPARDRVAEAVEEERISALKEYLDPDSPKAKEAQERYAKSKALLAELRKGTRPGSEFFLEQTGFGSRVRTGGPDGKVEGVVTKLGPKSFAALALKPTKVRSISSPSGWRRAPETDCGVHEDIETAAEKVHEAWSK